MKEKMKEDVVIIWYKNYFWDSKNQLWIKLVCELDDTDKRVASMLINKNGYSVHRTLKIMNVI